ncbi:MAG: VCBS repeat-containing protein, partial [Planctomycetes bacterium]|nr:VCBS repeat-containing protein [Planctomycetota bacterium]
VASGLKAFSSQTGQTRMWFGDGRGNFTDQTSRLPVDSDNSICLTIADVDGRNGPDLVIGNWRSNSGAGQTRLYLNDGAGNFRDVTSTNLPVNDDQVSEIVAFDVDGDGDLDLFHANGRYGPERNRLWINDGSGKFADASATWLDGRAGWTQSAVAIDIDGDGRLDLVELDATDPIAGGGARALLQRNGRFVVGHGLVPPGNVTSLAAVSGDIDGDGSVDLLVGVNGLSLWLLQNGRFRDVTEAWFGQRALAAGSPVAVADFDRDNDLDLVVAGGDLWINDNQSRFVNACAGVTPAAGAWRRSALADFDGDGLLDRVSVAVPQPTGFTGTQFSLQTARGFVDRTELLPATVRDADFVDAQVLDVDGDPSPDVLLISRDAPHRLLLWKRDHFVDASALLPAVVGPATVVRAGDVNGDGRDDIVIGQDGRVDLLWIDQGVGRGFRDEPSALPPRADATRDLAFLDFDGDGDLDLVCACGTMTNLERLRLYANDAQGRFTDVTDSSMVAFRGSFSAVVTADFDGDQKPDIATFDETTGRMYVWKNEGASGFGLRQQSPIVRTSRASVADIDGDGDPDVVCDNFVMVNSGGSVFALVRTATRGERVVDYDGDGDLDTIDGTAIASNAWRHVWGTRLARIGQPYEISIYAENGIGSSGATRTAVLFVGTPGAAIGTPYGSLRIDPTSLLQVGAFSVRWRQDVTLTIPNTPALVGLELASQALILHGATPSTWRFTNVWADRILR